MLHKKESVFGVKNTNENAALAVGFVLILFVIVFTLLRDNSFSTSNKSKLQSSDPASKQTTAAYKTISASELNKKILISTNKDDITLLDIRPFEAYIAEHIMDAINIPLDEFPIDSKINAHSLVVIIGADNADKDIATAIEKLEQENYKNNIMLAGGMTSWKQFIGATVTYGDPKSFVDQSKVSYLDPEELNAALTQKVPVYIIDVRSSEDYAAGHITGAKNISIDELEKRRNEISEKKIVVVGANELQEFQASVQMYDMLLVSPYVMRTAMPGWKDKGFTLVK
ncbi:MAG: Rhodanese-like protein [Parcubacteria group bacterium GW2011_GWD2_38_11]|nr:MAG: Rhodanese-like protein [Parcubacteria group bacterium GW2011_GWD2_38_11]